MGLNIEFGVSYLQLVLLSLGSRAGVEEINGENLGRKICQHNSPIENRQCQPPAAIHLTKGAPKQKDASSKS